MFHRLHGGELGLHLHRNHLYTERFAPRRIGRPLSPGCRGNIAGSQTRSVAGQSGLEDIAGTVSVNSDCTASGTIEVLVNGQLQRTAGLALVYDSNGNHMRAIFQSLNLPDGTNVPVVITVDGNRVTSRD
jgi:hypothetical protein